MYKVSTELVTFDSDGMRLDKFINEFNVLKEATDFYNRIKRLLDKHNIMGSIMIVDSNTGEVLK